MTILMSTWRLWMLSLISFLKIKWYVDSDTLWYFVYYVYACAHIWKKKIIIIFNLNVFGTNIVSLEHLCNYTGTIEFIAWLCYCCIIFYLSSLCRSNHLSQDNHLNAILEGISKRAYSKDTAVDEQASLQSILVKLLSHHKRIEDMVALVYLIENVPFFLCFFFNSLSCLI